MRISLCLLTWNEIKGCQHDVPLLPLADFDEVFAIDNNSDDGTQEYLREQGIEVCPQEYPTYNGAYRKAFERCSTEALVLFHPKGSVDPRELLKFRPLFEQGADLVVASRIIKGAVNEEDDQLFRPRKWFVQGLGLLAVLFWKSEGNAVWDVLHGFRGMRREAFWAIYPLEKGVSIDLEMVVRAYRKRMKRVEFPTVEKQRLSGDTHFKAFSTGKRLLAYLWREFSRSC